MVTPMSQASPSRGNRAAPSGSTATRGMIVVVVALVVGVLLIVKGGGGSVVADQGDAIDATTTTVAGAGGATSTTQKATTSTVTPPAQLKVIAANGSQIKGLAARTKTQLGNAGYTSVVATDATTQASTSIVYFAAGFEADAKAVAAVLGMPPARLGDMPAQVPVASVGDAKVVIILGPDAPNAVAPGATATTAAP
jgi:hypothetical protein